MRRYRWVIVLLIALPLLVASSLAGLYFFATRPDPVGRTLVYEFVETADAQAAEQTAAIVNRRFVVPPFSKPLALARVEGPRVLVDVYGNDPTRWERAKRLTGSLGTLELHVVANRLDHAQLIAFAEAHDFVELRDGEFPVARWVPVTESAQAGLVDDLQLAARKTTAGEWESLVAISPFNITGALFANVRPAFDRQQRPCLEFTMNATGTKLLAGMTTVNSPDPATGLQRRLAFVFDGKIVTAPAIASTIDERGEIIGDFSQGYVDDLVGILNAGSLPAAIRLVEERAP